MILWNSIACHNRCIGMIHRYLDTLNMIGIPEVRWKTMIETEDDERKWILIVSNRKRMVAGDVLAQSCVTFLKQVNNDISHIIHRKTFQLVKYVN